MFSYILVIIICVSEFRQSESASICNIHCDERPSKFAANTREPVSKMHFGRRFSLEISDSDKMAFGVLESGSPGDDIWLDRSFDDGASWNDGSKLGAKKIPPGERGTTTLMYNVDNPKDSNQGKGVMRTCGTASNRPEIVTCTEWAGLTVNTEKGKSIDTNNSEEKLEAKSSRIPWFWLWIGLGILGVLVGLFIICGVFLGRQWIRRRGRQGALDEYQISLFYNGTQEKNAVSYGSIPYDFTKYEVHDDDYQIDKKSVLGTGAFGIVYKGRIGEKTVAVKSTKPGSGKIYQESLLSEIKVLIHIGTHDNIVCLIAAKTKQISIGILYMFVEYCALGSLENCLRASRSMFNATAAVNNVDPFSADVKCDETPGGRITILHLYRWSHQIIQALQHLRNKKVIHGDLATRNILVFDVNTVKITDFGLSRKQYNYANYVKKNQEPLPWRWMAVESLRDLSFSHQSDIWSLGITLWEIFSLGSTPYPGMSYTVSFIEELENGFRPAQPKYAKPTLYKVMQSCWETKPDNRPHIDEIEAVLRTIFTNVNIS